MNPDNVDSSAALRAPLCSSPVAPSGVIPTPLAGLTRDRLLALAKAQHGLSAERVKVAHRAFWLGDPTPTLGPAFPIAVPIVEDCIEERLDTPTGEEVTAKAKLRLEDGNCIEMVRIPRTRGNTALCVSTQVGCRMGCRFCQTARMGHLRNLTPAEIVMQVWVARHVLKWPLRGIVFMGMGEPLDNFDAVATALEVLMDRPAFSFTQEHLNICTVGHVEGIAKLKALGHRRLMLSISLNAGTDEVRKSLMPINNRWSLTELQQALIAYRMRDQQVFIVNYCLLPGINDRPEDINGIADFLAPLGRSVLNLIPYNPGTDPIAKRPDEDCIRTFTDALMARGVIVRRRRTRGSTVMAACGQLGAKKDSDYLQ